MFSPSMCATKLYRRYYHKISNESRLLSHPQIFKIENDIFAENPALKDCFFRLLSIAYIEPDSHISLSQLIALIFLAVADEENRICPLDIAKEKLINALSKVDKINHDEPNLIFNKLIEEFENLHLDLIDSTADINQVFKINDLREMIIDQSTKKQFMQTCRFFYLSSGFELQITKKIFLATAHGNEEKIKKLFDASPRSIQHIATRINNNGDIENYVEDFSHRKHENISPFMYALWAMDIYMLNMMLESLKKAFDAGFVEAELIRQELLRQYNEVLTQGVNYIHTQTKRSADQTATSFSVRVSGEHHFNFQPLKQALQMYIDGACWGANVGGEQINVPAHVAQEYCYPKRAFYPTPSFQVKKSKFPRSLQVYAPDVDPDDEKDAFNDDRFSYWWPQEVSYIGSKYGVSRGARPLAASRWITTSLITAQQDLAAISTLSEVRANDVLRLHELLSMPLSNWEQQADYDEPGRICVAL